MLSVFVILLAVFIAIVLPLINFFTMRRVCKKVDELRNRVQILEHGCVSEGVGQKQAPKPSVPNAWFDTDVWSNNPWTSGKKTQKAVPSKKEDKSSDNIEQQFGGKIFVWMGGVALALAGFFMVRYSIEMGLLSPEIRTIIGIIFGIGMIVAGGWVRKYPRFADGTRISQALSGAGIADLYACIFAASSLYNLIPSMVGFSAMAAVTATALTLSLLHGMPIAALGLIGGFITPALFSSVHPQALPLFTYLYFVFAGLMFVSSKQRWGMMKLFAVSCVFVWTLLWILGRHFLPGDSLWLGLFLFAVCATFAVTSRKQEVCVEQSPLIDYFTMGGAVIFAGVVASQGGFGLLQWGMFGLIAVGGMGLAYFDQKRYGFVPLMSFAVNAVMFMSWQCEVASDGALILSLFAALYIVSGYIFQFRSKNPMLWNMSANMAALGFYLIAYLKLHHDPLTTEIPYFWSALALAFAAFGTQEAQQIARRISREYPYRQHLLAVCAATATAFISCAFAIEIDHKFLSIALAGEVMALAWINTKVDIKALRKISAILSFISLLLLCPQFFALSGAVISSILGSAPDFGKSYELLYMPVLKLGLPAAFFAIGSYFLRVKEDDRLVRFMESVVTLLVGAMAYSLLLKVFYAYDNSYSGGSFLKRGIVTNAFFMYAFACVWIGKRFDRSQFSTVGVLVFWTALLRIAYFDLFMYNPIYSEQYVGNLPLFNSLFVTYAFPVMWLWASVNTPLFSWKSEQAKAVNASMLVLSFAFISFEIRQFFHGSLLNGSIVGNAEIYSYSIAWLLFGIALLFFGVLRQSKMVRSASLAVMLLTIGKVFLYDASALTGLWRVFSFFGLGLSLLGLSWFYSRFIFGPARR